MGSGVAAMALVMRSLLSAATVAAAGAATRVRERVWCPGCRGVGVTVGILRGKVAVGDRLSSTRVPKNTP